MNENTVMDMEQDTTTQLPQEYIEENGCRHFPYTADFIDEDGQDVRRTYHFRKPQRQHIVRIAKAGKDKAYDSQKEVLVELALSSERQVVREFFEQYPLVVNSFGDEIFKTAGAGSVFRGK